MQEGLTQWAVLEAVHYDERTGLVPVVVQDINTKEVLTLAYANREALKRTFGSGYAWFWSRSRQEYWQKGATSGHVQRVQEVRVDCDGDAVLYLVDPTGPACHTGNRSCFYRGLTYRGHGPTKAGDNAGESEIWRVAEGAHTMESSSREDVIVPESERMSMSKAGNETRNETMGEQKTVGEKTKIGIHNTLDLSVLAQLWEVVDRRYRQRPAGSYTTYLFAHGVDKAAKKLGEEATEVVIAAKNAESTVAGKQEVIEESADLLYHLLVLWRSVQVFPDEVLQVLASRSQ